MTAPTSFTCYAADGVAYMAIDPLLITSIARGATGETSIYTHPRAAAAVDYITFESFEDAQQRWHDTLCARLAANHGPVLVSEIGPATVTYKSRSDD